MLEIDTSNTFGVALPVAGDHVHITLHRLLAARGGVLTRDEALTLASWLAALADPGGERFAAVLEKVRNT